MGDLNHTTPEDPLLKHDPKDPGVETARLNVLLGTPCYGGVSHVSYNQAVRHLMARFQHYGVRHQICETMTESLIPRARNAMGNIVSWDLDPAGAHYTHLLFIDADIGFHPDNIIQALGFNKDIVGLPYACKDINWEKIKEAVVKNPQIPAEHLYRMGQRPIVNTNGQAVQFDTGKPVQFPQLGTGALLIKREVFLGFAQKEPNRKYILMPGEMKFGPRDYAYDFFPIGVNPQTRYYDSEDYRFCLDAIRLGYECWMLPWAVTTHTGNYCFTMDIAGQAHYGVTSGEIVKPDSQDQNVGGFVPATVPVQGTGLTPSEGVIIS